MGRHPNHERRRRIAKLRVKGLTFQEIGHCLGVTRQCVQQTMKSAGQKVVPDHVRLLHGPYPAPALRRGDRATCLFRDGEVIVTGWSDAPISWPRCRLPGTHGGGSGLLLSEELVQAIRSESSVSLQYWWGVSEVTVWRWRKAFGVTQWGTDGSRRLHHDSSEKGASKTRGKRLPPTTIEKMRRAARADGRRPPERWTSDGWTAQQLALLGTMPDDDLAQQIGRTATAVRVMRNRRGIPTAVDRRRRGHRGPGPEGSAWGETHASQFGPDSK